MLLLLTGLWILLSIVFGVCIGTAIRRADRAETSWHVPHHTVREVTAGDDHGTSDRAA